MENNKRACSCEEHKNFDAIYYCQDCKIYLCNKCDNYHKNLFKNHNKYHIDKDTKDIFIDICMEISHPNKLEFYCKDHNVLCCVACIAKIEGKGYGQHRNCDICFIENIKEEKKNKLEENLKYLEDISISFKNSINEIKEIFEKINTNKEELKLKIQNIFTKTRNILNEREDQLLSEVDKKYKEIFSNIDMQKEIEKLPDKIQLNIEKGKSIKKEWNESNKLSSIITDCIKIEKNIKDIKSINENIQKDKLNNSTNIVFIPEDDKLENFMQTIRTFGKILEKEKQKQDNILVSDIITNKDDIDLICKWINKKVNKFQLIYKATVDGDSINDFDKKCLNKGPTLLIIKSSKDKIFGGFSEKNWTPIGGVSSPDSFLFNIYLKKKYNINNAYIHHYTGEFGYGDDKFYELKIKNRFLSVNSNCYSISNYSEYYSTKYELTNGDEYFKIKELEIFQIFFN